MESLWAGPSQTKSRDLVGSKETWPSLGNLARSREPSRVGDLASHRRDLASHRRYLADGS